MHRGPTILLTLICILTGVFFAGRSLRRRAPIGTLILSSPGRAGSDRVGPIEDLTGDGRAEFVLRTEEDGPEGVLIRVVSGPSFRELYRLSSSPERRLTGGVWATTDPDGDGLRELIVECEGPGGRWLELRSGNDGLLLRRLPLDGSGDEGGQGEKGVRVLPTGDVDGDGHWDAYVSEEDAHGGWTMVLYSGREWTALRRSDHSRGRCAGDLDGDGVPDYFAPNRSGEELLGISGRTGEVLLRFPGRAVSVCPAGDVDGDGEGDLIVVEEESWVPGFVGLWTRRSGRVGQRLESESPFFAGVFTRPASVGDLDGDGWPEVLVSQGSHDGGPDAFAKDYGKVYVYSPLRGRVLWTQLGRWRHAGLSHLGAVDVDGDGVRDVLTMATGRQGHPGELRVYSGARITGPRR